MALEYWQCPACAYKTILPTHPMPLSLLTPCTEPAPWELGQCARLPRWQEWPAEHLLPALRHRDASQVMFLAEAHAGPLALVVDTSPVLHALGIYEVCLLDALISGRSTSYWGWDLGLLQDLVRMADPAKLRAASDPFPTQPTYTLYRGVAGAGRARRSRGLSWTGSLEKAWWFAQRQRHLHLADPAVYTAQVPAKYVFAYTNARKEDEYLLLLPPRFPVQRLPEPTDAPA